MGLYPSLSSSLAQSTSFPSLPQVSTTRALPHKSFAHLTLFQGLLPEEPSLQPTCLPLKKIREVSACVWGGECTHICSQGWSVLVVSPLSSFGGPIVHKCAIIANELQPTSAPVGLGDRLPSSSTYVKCASITFRV